MAFPPDLPPRVLDRRRFVSPRSHGTALVQALMAALIALIGASLLASRLLSSRFNVFSRGDSLAAREAAEFGLNELQATLNSDFRGYLWVTKRNSWSTVTRSALTTCQVAVRDASGNEVTTLPALPDGVSSARTIRSDADVVITYQLTAFEPPSLPDSQTATLNQVRFCGSGSGASTAAAFFGNLGGGSALMTVTGTVQRGSQSTTFRLDRRTDVGFPANSASGGTGQVDVAMRVLGGSASLGTLRLNNNICYGDASGCEGQGNNRIPADIGCSSLSAADCASGNPGSNNAFRQASAPDMPAAFLLPAGWNWDGANGLSRDMTCDVTGNSNNNTQCQNAAGTSGNSAFPYFNRSRDNLPTANDVLAMTNSNLVRGCYFSASNGGLNESAGNSASINCLFRGKGAAVNFITGNQNLIVYTQPLPVNIFFYDEVNPYFLGAAGIVNNELANWQNLRILGRPSSSTVVSTCNGARIINTQSNYINGAFIWLPSGMLEFSSVNANDTIFNVVWACGVTASASGGSTNNLKIAVPRPSDSGFGIFLDQYDLRQKVLSSYRAFGGVNVVPGS